MLSSLSNCRSFVGRFLTLSRRTANAKSLFGSKCGERVFAVQNAERQLVTASSSFLKVGTVTVSQQRFKSKRKGKQSKIEEKEDEDDDSSDVEELEDLPETMKVDSPSLKIEFVLTRCLFKSRAQFEESVSKQNLRVNGEPVESKDLEVALGDVFDHILGRNQNSYDSLDVNRVTIMKLPDKFVKGRAVLEVERQLRLTINNYKNKWEGISIHVRDEKR